MIKIITKILLVPRNWLLTLLKMENEINNPETEASSN